MIFSNNYGFDRTLWFILVCDRENRYDIAKLIREVPKDLFDRIHFELENCCCGDVDLPLKKFNKAIRTDDGGTYFYTISINRSMIILRLSIWKGSDNTYQEVIQLTLYPISLEKIQKIDSVNPSFIGDYFHTISRLSFLSNTLVVDGNDREYELLDGNVYDVIVQTVDGDYEKIIDIDRIPNDINFDDLDNRKSINRLIRRRGRK